MAQGVTVIAYLQQPLMILLLAVVGLLKQSIGVWAAMKIQMIAIYLAAIMELFKLSIMTIKWALLKKFSYPSRINQSLYRNLGYAEIFFKKGALDFKRITICGGESG